MNTYPVVKTYEEAVAVTQALCDAIRDNPQARRAVRESFYEQFGDADNDGLSYGDSELAFLDWEIRAGVLEPETGSHWWRNVNLNFIYLSELAGCLAQNQLPGDQATFPTRCWLDFIAEPTPRHWYRAHNASILAGFHLYEDDARLENAIGQEFLNITLYRLMFAQALVEDATIFGEIGAWLADPRGFSVTLLVHLADFYPPHYPLTEADRPIIEGKGKGLEETAVRLMDGLIRHFLRELYQAAAAWNQAPELLNYLDGNKPAYPPAAGHREVLAAAQAVASLEGVLAGQDVAVAEDGASGLQAG
ncbi:hypothetical protein [uncultured Pseudomonas sp.]|uniref:hypothetical protein n=1 Tax=uncultured Pseudomonas sp. TaxID=114707 RepID=UPI0025DA6CFD|nr:hypothetical protein [uncultured Pseudomonas sp.]